MALLNHDVIRVLVSGGIGGQHLFVATTLVGCWFAKVMFVVFWNDALQ